LLKQHFPSSGFIEAGDQSGHRLYYEEYGPKDQPAFVMAHGNAGYLFDPQKLSMWDFDKQHVVIMHARGVGKSQPAAKVDQNLYPDLMQDIEVVRQQLNLGKINLFGWSGGAAVSLLYAQTYPQNCKGLVLYGAYLGADQELMDYYARNARKYPDGWARFCKHYGETHTALLIRKSNDVLVNGTADEKLQAAVQYELIFEPASVTSEILLKRHSAWEWQNLVNSRIVFANMMNKAYGLTPDQIENNLPLLGDIPVLFVNGANDHVTPASVAQRLAGKISCAHTVVIDPADHDVHNPWVQTMLGQLLADFPPPKPSAPQPQSLRL